MTNTSMDRLTLLRTSMCLLHNRKYTSRLLQSTSHRCDWRIHLGPQHAPIRTSSRDPDLYIYIRNLIGDWSGPSSGLYTSYLASLFQ